MTLFDLAAEKGAQRAIAEQVAAADWAAAAHSLDEDANALLKRLLTAEECRTLAHSYQRDEAFRSRIVMERYGFGRGEYKYWAYPLPPVVAALREALYPPLAEIAGRWSAMLGESPRYPPSLAAFLEGCHRAGQTKPTPLLLKYGPGDYNCLHRDLYGEHLFPLQVTILLSAPGDDFSGGEFVLVEGRPRRQSRAEIVPLGQGDAVIFPVHHRPVRGARGFYRAELRHGVSRLRGGERYSLGIIFHDAR